MGMRVSEREVRDAVRASRSWAETLRRLGYCTTGNARLTLKKYVRLWGVSVDHFNGVRDDHRIENLRIVCPNCAATLDTHCGRNIPRKRVCEGCGSVFSPKRSKHRYCTHSCFVSTRLLEPGPRPETRKVERPPYKQLMRELKTSNYLAVGRKYGVSDNAIRKWVKWYEREREAKRKRAAEPPAKAA